MSQILKSKEKIINCYHNSNKKKKNITKSQYEDVEKALVIWVKQMREKKISLNTDVIKTKAKELAETMGYSDFKASDGYLMLYKTKYF